MKTGELLARSIYVRPRSPWHRRLWVKLTGQKHLEDGWLYERMCATIRRDRGGDTNVEDS